MVRLVHEQSEKDIQARKLWAALAELTAQLLRLSAGAGSVARLVEALKSFDDVVAESGGAVLLQRTDLQTALRACRNGWDEDLSDVEDAREEIIRHALRVAASRLEANPLQERRSSSDLTDALGRLDRTREDNRRRFIEERREQKRTVEDAVAGMLSPTMRRGLAFLAEADSSARRAIPRPQQRTLAALEERGLIVRGEGPLGYALTPAGKRAHKGRRQRR